MKISESSQTENRYTDNRFIMLPTVDVCFKGLMNNPIVRKGFIAALLKADPETIAETTLLPTILHQDYPDDKLGILDVRVLMENGTQIDMEMQVAYFEYWDARVLFYLSRIFTDQLRKGESYENLKKCIHVSILDFIHFKEDDKCHRTICFCDEKTGRKYTDLMEIQILELRKLPENLKNGGDILNWMRFLGGKTRREFEAMAKTDAYINEAYKELEKLSADERAKLEYEAREKAIRDHNALVNSAIRQGLRQGIEQGIEQGRKQGIEQGIEQGRKQGIEQGIEQGREEEKKLLIRKMLENGAEPELISRLTGLSPDIIKSVETSVNNEI